MPILTLEIVLRPEETLPEDLASQLAQRAGDILRTPPGGTWVKLTPLAPSQYAENNLAAPEIYPVFVTVLKAHLPPSDALQTEITALTAAIAELCDRPPENVHLFYTEGHGRVAFGGRLVSYR